MLVDESQRPQAGAHVTRAIVLGHVGCRIVGGIERVGPRMCAVRGATVGAVLMLLCLKGCCAAAANTGKMLLCGVCAAVRRHRGCAASVCSVWAAGMRFGDLQERRMDCGPPLVPANALLKQGVELLGAADPM